MCTSNWYNYSHITLTIHIVLVSIADGAKEENSESLSFRDANKNTIDQRNTVKLLEMKVYV